jgi:hypothetical protein
MLSYSGWVWILWSGRDNLAGCTRSVRRGSATGMGRLKDSGGFLSCCRSGPALGVGAGSGDRSHPVPPGGPLLAGSARRSRVAPTTSPRTGCGGAPSLHPPSCHVAEHTDTCPTQADRRDRHQRPLRRRDEIAHQATALPSGQGTVRATALNEGDEVAAAPPSSYRTSFNTRRVESAVTASQLTAVCGISPRRRGTAPSRPCAGGVDHRRPRPCRRNLSDS